VLGESLNLEVLSFSGKKARPVRESKGSGLSPFFNLNFSNLEFLRFFVLGESLNLNYLMSPGVASSGSWGFGRSGVGFGGRLGVGYGRGGPLGPLEQGGELGGMGAGSGVFLPDLPYGPHSRGGGGGGGGGVVSSAFPRP
jgi:hypothetical protein